MYQSQPCTLCTYVVKPHSVIGLSSYSYLARFLPLAALLVLLLEDVFGDGRPVVALGLLPLEGH